eukprot:SAG31_NODE_25254_length_465_cov_0.565574_2_plen_99_part_01
MYVDPENEKGQTMYPRRHMFEQVCGVFASVGKVVPVFNDKHLSYNWADAKWMYDRALELGVPFQSGSSLPFTWRKPCLEHPIGTAMDEAVVVACESTFA